MHSTSVVLVGERKKKKIQIFFPSNQEKRFHCSGDSIINFGGNIDKLMVKNICHFNWFINDLAIMNYLGYGMKSIIFNVYNRLDT